MPKKTSDRTLKLKRVFAYSIYNNLRNTPPKDYPTTGEIKETISSVMPAFKEHIGVYLDLVSDAEALSVKVAAKEITDKEGQAAVDKINKTWKEYSQEHGSEIVSIGFSEEGFKILRTQFERENWGNKWTANLDEYAEMLEAFTEAGKK